jgi:hypothetical protein
MPPAIAVPRLAISQRHARLRTVQQIGSLMSPSPAPDRRKISSLGLFLNDVDNIIRR